MKFREEEIRYYTLLSNGRVEKIQGVVAEYFGVTVELLQSNNRHRFLCDIRFIAMKLTKDNLPVTLKAIGYLFGYRDHSTVINALAKVDLAIQVIGIKKYYELETKVKEAIKSI